MTDRKPGTTSRRTVIASIGTGIATGLAGCSAGLSSEETEMTMGSELPGSHIMSEVANSFADDFNEQASSASIEVLSGGALGADQAVAELTAEGEVELSYGTAAFYTYAPTYNFIGHPFVLTKQEHATAFFESEVGEALTERIRNEGNQELVGMHMLGTREVYATDPLQSPEDGEGLTLRSPGIQPFQRLIGEAFNVGTEVLPSGDTYTSIETGLVDGIEGEAFTGRSLSMYEVCDYLNLTGHCVGPGGYYVNNDILDELDENDSELLTDLLNQHVSDTMDEAWDAAEEQLDYMEDQGMNRLEADFEAFYERAEPILQEAFDSGAWSDADTSLEEIREVAPL